MSSRKVLAPGPFRADQIRSGDPYELSNGHAVLCLPTGRRGSTRNLIGGAALETDPEVVAAGVDLGVSTQPGMLRAPDVAVGAIEDAPGWSPQAPPLAVEYADGGQDEEELQAKITELLAAGTQHIWVVRLVGERRVEVHEPGKKMRLERADGVLHAPGILRNPVPVAVLYDREAAHDATLRNLLQRKGYSGLESVRSQGREEGREEGRTQALQTSILTIVRTRGLDVSSIEARVLAEHDVAILERWLERAVTAAQPEAIIEGAA